MDLRQLRYFVALAEEGHFGRAAERVFVVQQALSGSIRNLEDELGVRLFERTTRRVQLTPAGSEFLTGARQVLALVEQTADRARRAARGEVGRLAVGFVSGLAFGGLPEVVRTFRERFPHVAVELLELTAAEQEQALRERRIDVGFVLLPVRDPSLAREAMWREPLIVALPAGHPLAARERLRLAELANEDFVFFPRHVRAAYFDQVMSLATASGFQPRIVQEAIEVPTLLSLVAAGIGVFLPIRFFSKLALPGVAYRPLDDAPVVEIDAAWRREDASPVVQQFLSVGREVLGAAP
ncbi:LysR family transcriptional regulator [Deinococcus pimensis]|uniref:LysR family transcriptional regulator n=1 Tax=Deinococcus pimensis TaxID=309888 RepID=UPI0004857641|nr:LysR family transcriptional regulator [Deinococcus pimensis]